MLGQTCSGVAHNKRGVAGNELVIGEGRRQLP